MSAIRISYHRKKEKKHKGRHLFFLLAIILFLSCRMHCVIAEDDDNKSQPTTPSTSASTSASQQQQRIARRLSKIKEKREKKQKSFIKWCQSTLGIQSLLEIQEFEYENYYLLWKDRLRLENDYYLDYDNDNNIIDYDYLMNGDENTVHSDSGSNGQQDESIPLLDNNNANNGSASKTIIIRGLAATRDVDMNEVIISIPYHALLTIQTTIDNDPILSTIIGPQARAKYGWILTSSLLVSSSTEDIEDNMNSDVDSKTYDKSINNNNNNEKRKIRKSSSTTTTTTTTTTTINEDEMTDLAINETNNQSSNYYEVGLLTVALLYHRSLGELSPIWFHIDSLLDNTVSGIGNIPLLWDKQTLQKEFDGLKLGPSGDEIRRLVLTMKKDVQNMYNDIMGVLMRDHKDIFGKPKSSNNSALDDNANDDKSEWMFSYEKFEWAFAMVNSRKWHLPLADVDNNSGENINVYHSHAKSNNNHVIINEESGGASANAMPAQQPTDEYMSQQDEAIRMEYIDENIVSQPAPALSPSIPKTKAKSNYNVIMKQTFLAPLADMLNFGPPCAKGRYNTKSKTFEVIATCKFSKGQEVTFWYSDDCDNIMIANYGFTHPLISQCLSVEDWKNRSEIWRNHALSLEKTLEEVYEELYETLKDLESCDYDANTSYKQKHVIDETGDGKDTKDATTLSDHDSHSGIRRTKPRENEDTDAEDL